MLPHITVFIVDTSVNGTENTHMSRLRHLSNHPAQHYCVFGYSSGLGLRFDACSHTVPAAYPTAQCLHGRQAETDSHRAVGLTADREWWCATLLFVVQCCLCSFKRQHLLIPTISGRFVSSSVHIYAV